MTRHYFDHNATTPLAPEVARVLGETLQYEYGNASSIHREGQKARELLEGARRRVAGHIGANAAEIVFTSGGTEADNLAILGLVRKLPGARKHVITTTVEHPAVLEPCRQLAREDVEVTCIGVNRDGAVDVGELYRHIKAETVLISVMHANNEVGTVQPLREIASAVRATREAGQRIYLHSDGVQALGRLPVNVDSLGVDLYSMSAHKVYGPKGVGALYVRKRVPLGAIHFGGRHERERRAGTENVAGAAAFARALELVQATEVFERLAVLRDQFEKTVLDSLSGVDVNGSGAERLPNTSNLYFEGIDGESMVIALDLKGFAVSSGSACSSGSIEPSHVLLAMGRSPKEARRCVRFSFGLGNTIAETDALSAAVIECARHLRAVQPRTNTSRIYAHN